MRWDDTEPETPEDSEAFGFDTLAETIDWYVECGFRVIMQTEDTAQLVRPKTFSLGSFILFGPFYLVYHILVKREDQVYLKPRDTGEDD